MALIPKTDSKRKHFNRDYHTKRFNVLRKIGLLSLTDEEIDLFTENFFETKDDFFYSLKEDYMKTDEYVRLAKEKQLRTFYTTVFLLVEVKEKTILNMVKAKVSMPKSIVGFSKRLLEHSYNILADYLVTNGEKDSEKLELTIEEYYLAIESCKQSRNISKELMSISLVDDGKRLSPYMGDEYSYINLVLCSDISTEEKIYMMYDSLDNDHFRLLYPLYERCHYSDTINLTLAEAFISILEKTKNSDNIQEYEFDIFLKFAQTIRRRGSYQSERLEEIRKRMGALYNKKYYGNSKVITSSSIINLDFLVKYLSSESIVFLSEQYKNKRNRYERHFFTQTGNSNKQKFYNLCLGQEDQFYCGNKRNLTPSEISFFSKTSLISNFRYLEKETIYNLRTHITSVDYVYGLSMEDLDYKTLRFISKNPKISRRQKERIFSELFEPLMSNRKGFSDEMIEKIHLFKDFYDKDRVIGYILRRLYKSHRLYGAGKCFFDDKEENRIVQLKEIIEKEKYLIEKL